jgi:hypothetical protein
MTNTDISNNIHRAKVEFDKGDKMQALSTLKKVVDELEKEYEIPGTYFIIEMHGGIQYSAPCLDEDGNVIEFETRKDAQKYAQGNCQDGIIIGV